MQKEQSSTLHSLIQENGWKCTWHNVLDEVHHDENLYTMIVAHEFFDALPFHLLKSHGIYGADKRSLVLFLDFLAISQRANRTSTPLARLKSGQPTHHEPILLPRTR